jgi:hypothetical protein
MAKILLMFVWNLILISTLILVGINEMGIDIDITGDNIMRAILILMAIRGAFSISP